MSSLGLGVLTLPSLQGGPDEQRGEELQLGLFLLCIRPARATLKDVAKSLAHPKVIFPILGMAGYTVGLVVIAGELGAWSGRLLPATVVWAIGPGISLLFGIATRKRDERFFPSAAGRAARLTVFVEVIVGVFVFSFPVELILLAIVAILGGLSVIAGTRDEYRPAKRLVDGVLTVVGLGLLSYAVIHIVSEWPSLDKAFVARVLALPVWLTLGLFPYLYLVALWAGYGHAFGQIDLDADDRAAGRRARLGLILALHFRAGKANAFGGYRSREISEAESVREARRVGRAFLRSEWKRAENAREAEERLERYAGVDGADEDGERLDQREFQEIKNALQWLATAQMGWYENDGDRYRTDLLDVLAPFDGLPEDHGIELAVASDGKSWWAWRRTVTGWCFAIGAAEPPPDQWLYDGADPPEGFPGQDLAWGEPWGLEAANW